MNRYAPELALLTGGVLAGSFAVFGVWTTGDLPRTVLVSAGLLYPFAAYAVYRDTDPATAVPPRAVFSIAILVGVAVFVDITLGLSPGARDFGGPGMPAALTGLGLALVVVLPVAAYQVSYGSPLLPGQVPTFVAAGIVAGGLLPLVGLLVGNPLYGAVDGLLVGLAAGITGLARGFDPEPRQTLRGVGAGVLAAFLVLVGGILAGGRPGPAVFAATAYLLGPALFHALTADTAAFE